MLDKGEGHANFGVGGKGLRFFFCTEREKVRQILTFEASVTSPHIMYVERLLQCACMCVLGIIESSQAGAISTSMLISKLTSKERSTKIIKSITTI